MEQVLIRIGADLTAFDKRLKEAEASVEKLQKKAQEKSPFKKIDAGLNSINSSLATAVRQTGTFLGVAWGLHGAFNAIERAVGAWVGLMKTSLSTIDEFRMGIATSSGMLTALSQVSEPELGKAYGAWKEYHDWLYRASLETDRKVAASGQDIFEAGKELAIRGLVPKTKDQVYVTGLLVDWIRSVTKGLSQQQQLWQEVRSLFEGQMRLGAQALAQFVKVDPQFQEKFDAARKSAIALGDAQPVWDLLAKTMRGMKYAGKDMELTLNSLQNTAKSAVGLGLIETFSEAYDSLVKYGWQILDTFYQNGKLTAQGQEMANALRVAWDTVKPSVDQLVNAIVNGGPTMANRIGMVAAGLGNIAVQAAHATAKILEMVAAIGAIDLNTLLTAAGIVGAGMVGGGILGGLLLGPGGVGVGIKGGGMAATVIAGYYALSKGEELAAGKSVDIMAGKAGISRANVEAAATAEKRRANQTEGAAIFKPSSTTKDQLDYVTKAAGEYTRTLAERAKNMRDAGMKGDAVKEEISRYHRAGQYSYAGDDVTRAMRGAAFDDFIKSASGVSDKAPKVPGVGMSGGKDKKGKGGGGGGAERKPIDYQLWMQEAKAKRDLAIALAEIERDELKKKNDGIEKDLKHSLEQGLISYQDYYAKLTAMHEAEIVAEKKILAEEVKAVELAHEDSVRAINRKIQVREYTGEEAATALRIEELRYEKEKAKIKAKITAVEIDGAEKRKQLIFEETEALRKQQGVLQDIQLGLAWGPLEERKAAVEKVRQEYANRRKGFAAGTPEHNKLKELEDMAVFQAKFREQIDGFVDAITSGIDGLVDALMEGGDGLLKAAEDMFTALFKQALIPGMEWLQETLTNLFKKLFSESGLGAGFGGALMGAIGLAGMMITKSMGSKSSFTSSGATSQVTTHEAVRGVVAGEQSIAIGEISESLREAFSQSESYLREIALNTRNLVLVNSGADLSKYFNDSLAKGA